MRRVQLFMLDTNSCGTHNQRNAFTLPQQPTGLSLQFKICRHSSCRQACTVYTNQVHNRASRILRLS